MSAATRIPQELFSEILWHAQNDFGACFQDRMHTIYSFSLVCRYWASKLRRHIFCSLILGSRNYALEFTALAKCSIWPAHSILPIGKYVERIWFIVNVQDLSWIHLVLHCMPDNILGPTGDSMIEIFLDFECSGTRDKLPVQAPRHVYHGLPRRFPPKIRPRFWLSLVSVSDLSFGNLNHFSDFVFSAQQHLSAHQSVWKT